MVMGVSGLRIWLILRLICRGVRSGSTASAGWSLDVLLHAFRSFARRPICLRFARDIGGLSWVVAGVSCLGCCIGQTLVAMS